MSDYLILTLTDAGRLSMMDYLGSGFNISFSHVGLGSGNYIHSAKTEELAEKWANFPLIGGYVDQDNHCLVLTAMGQLSETKKVSELGVYDEKGTLFAVLAKPEGYIFKTEIGGFFSFNISIALAENIPNKKIKLSFSPQEQLLQALLTLHLQHKDPHPQYKQYIMAILRAHLSEFNPHDQYARRSNVAAIIRAYIDQVRKLYSLFTTLFTKSIYGGCIQYPVTTTVELGDSFKDDLKENKNAVFITPENFNEGWTVSRLYKSFILNVYVRSGTNRIPYAGSVNWIVLSDIGESPINSFPELISLGVTNANGQFVIQKPVDKTVNLTKSVILLSPEGQHEGWSIDRTAESCTVTVFNRTRAARVGYSGPVSYAVLSPKDGTDLTAPSTYPCLLMAGISSNGGLSIKRPPGQTWDFTDPNIVVLVTPEGQHEGWEIKRKVDEIFINVFQRSNTNIVAYNGGVNWAIFLKDTESDIYGAGTYEITIPAKSKAEVHLVGAGGSGAGSLWSPNTAADWLKMDNGNDTSFTIDGQIELIAGGGQGGYRGVWNNGTDFKQGIAGEGGQVNIVNLGQAQIISKTDGEKAYLQTTIDTCNRDTRGGASRWKLGSGGTGGFTVETRKHRCYGAGGGSGAHIHFTYSNDTTAAVKATLVVGENGVADWVSPELNNGKAGEAGCASVKIISL